MMRFIFFIFISLNASYAKENLKDSDLLTYFPIHFSFLKEKVGIIFRKGKGSDYQYYEINRRDRAVREIKEEIFLNDHKITKKDFENYEIVPDTDIDKLNRTEKAQTGENVTYERSRCVEISEDERKTKYHDYPENICSDVTFRINEEVYVEKGTALMRNWLTYTNPVIFENYLFLRKIYPEHFNDGGGISKSSQGGLFYYFLKTGQHGQKVKKMDLVRLNFTSYGGASIIQVDKEKTELWIGSRRWIASVGDNFTEKLACFIKQEKGKVSKINCYESDYMSSSKSMQEYLLVEKMKALNNKKEPPEDTSYLSQRELQCVIDLYENKTVSSKELERVRYKDAEIKYEAHLEPWYACLKLGDKRSRDLYEKIMKLKK